MLVLLHVIFLDASQLAGITAFAANLIVLIFLFWKPRTSYSEAMLAELLQQLREPNTGVSSVPR